MLVLVFSWVTISTAAGKATLPLTWSPWVWVLISVMTGLSVRVLILSRIGWPQPGFFASTTTTPPAVANTAVLPPPPPEHPQVVLDLLALGHDRRTWRGRLCPHHGQRAQDEQHAEHHSTSHDIPPGKKTRWMNQKAPAAMTTTDPATASCRPAASFRERSAASAVATAATT